MEHMGWKILRLMFSFEKQNYRGGSSIAKFDYQKGYSFKSMGPFSASS